MNSSQQHTFSHVPQAEIPRSSFNRSHGHKTTFSSGYLIPIFADEALPGDTWQLHASVFARLATPIVPIMDNLKMDTFWFAIPNRLLWDNWQKFCGEQENPGDSTDYLVPQVVATATGFEQLSMFDYMGIPTLVPSLSVNALFARAYNLVWNEWFRDQNLQTRAPFSKGDGPDLVTDFPLRKRGKRHDYFTSCLPWPQKGPGVEVPMGGFAQVAPPNATTPVGFGSSVRPDGVISINSSGANNTDVPINIRWPAGPSGGAQDPLTWNLQPGLQADLSTATGVTINAMRESFQIQKLLERDARGGTRYTEILRSHFGVVSPDARLQRPEFLAGGSVNITINPVSQTSGSGSYTDTPQGNLAGYGVAAGSPGGFSKSFVEHSIIIGLVMVRADLSYQQGLNRMFSRRTRYDYYWPAFSHLGEQAVLNKEIFAQGPAVIDPTTTEPYDDGVFGYQERWAEYRYSPSMITGKFRSNDPQPLDVWHLAQDFETLPALNGAFIEENPPVARVIAVQTEPEFLFDSMFMVKCTRPMPTYSVPGMIDHF